MIDLNRDELEELYWTKSNREFAKILGIQTGDISVLLASNGIETKSNSWYGHQYTEKELEERRERILKKIAARQPTPIIEEPVKEPQIDKLDIARKGLLKILEISDNAYVLAAAHETLKRLKK